MSLLAFLRNRLVRNGETTILWSPWISQEAQSHQLLQTAQSGIGYFTLHIGHDSTTQLFKVIDSSKVPTDTVILCPLQFTIQSSSNEGSVHSQSC